MLSNSPTVEGLGRLKLFEGFSHPLEDDLIRQIAGGLPFAGHVRDYQSTGLVNLLQRYSFGVAISSIPSGASAVVGQHLAVTSQVTGTPFVLDAVEQAYHDFGEVVLDATHRRPAMSFEQMARALLRVSNEPPESEHRLDFDPDDFPSI